MRRRQAPAKQENSERWLLTYADLITLLLVFFVVLYSISKADARQFTRLSGSLQRAFNNQVLDGFDPTSVEGNFGNLTANSMLEDFVETRSQLIRQLPSHELPEGVTVFPSKDGFTIRFANNILFSSGRADLNPEAEPVLQAVGAVLHSMPNEVRIEGHTDNVPINTPLFPSNWELSASRAIAVATFFIERSGFDPAHVAAVGYGEYRPLADNSQRETRALNRRIDILVVNPDVGRPLADGRP